MKFRDGLAGLAFAGINGAIAGEQNRRERDRIRTQNNMDRERKDAELIRRDDLIAHRQVTQEKIKQQGLIAREKIKEQGATARAELKNRGGVSLSRSLYAEDGRPLMTQQAVDDHLTKGGKVFKDPPTRDKGTNSFAPSLKDLSAAQQHIDDQYESYLYEFDDGAEDGFLGFGGKKGTKKPLDKAAFAKQYIHPRYLEIVYGKQASSGPERESTSTPATSGSGSAVTSLIEFSIAQSHIDEKYQEYLHEFDTGEEHGIFGFGAKKGTRTPQTKEVWARQNIHPRYLEIVYGKQTSGAPEKESKSTPPTSGSAAASMLNKLGAKGGKSFTKSGANKKGAINMPPLNTDLNNVARKIARAAKGSIDPGDIVRAADSAVKEIGRVAPEVAAQFVDGAKGTASAVGTVLGLVEKAVVEGLIDANNITGQAIMDLMMKAHGVMTADTDQRNAYR